MGSYTISLFLSLFSLSRALLKHTISALRSKTFVFFLVFEKTYLYSVVQLPKKLTCNETLDDLTLQTHSIRRQSSYTKMKEVGKCM